jgi:hypothetical protein
LCARKRSIWWVLYARKVNMVSVVYQKSQYGKCCVPEKSICTILTFLAHNTYHIDPFWHTTLIILTFSDSQHLSYWPILTHNTYHIDFSGTQHLPYWLFWHVTFTILTSPAHNIYHIDFSGTQHNARKVNMISVLCQKRSIW